LYKTKKMLKNATLVHEISHEELLVLFKGLENQLNEFKQNMQPKTPTEYLTRNEVAEMLKCDLSTLWNWAQKGKLVPYGIGNRVYYKRNDIEAAIIQLTTKKG